MEDQGFRQFYQALIGRYCLPSETVKQLLGRILTSLSQKKKESENNAQSNLYTCTDHLRDPG